MTVVNPICCAIVYLRGSIVHTLPEQASLTFLFANLSSFFVFPFFSISVPATRTHICQYGCVFVCVCGACAVFYLGTIYLVRVPIKESFAFDQPFIAYLETYLMGFY